jgi:hypothetical protein
MSMKDLLSKMTELQGTVESVEVAPVTATDKKVLNESSNTMKESTKPSLKSIFSSLLSEAEQVTIQPAKQNTQVIKQGDKTLGTVTNPSLANQIKQSIGKGEMTLAGDDELEEGDVVPFRRPANKSVSAQTPAADWQKVPQHILDLANDWYWMEYASGSYDAVTDPNKSDEKTLKYQTALIKQKGWNIEIDDEYENIVLTSKDGKKVLLPIEDAQDSEGWAKGVVSESKLTEKAKSKVQQKAAGAALTAKRGDAPKSKLKGASKEMAKMPTKELEKFAKTEHKGLPDKKEKTAEAAMPTHDGDFGAGLGAGRNSKTLESKKAKPDYIDLDKDGNKKESMKKAAADKQKVSTMKKTNEAKAKPDFLDLDKDGNKKESMKKAAADKKKKAVKEGANPAEAARLLGKAHALGKDPFACKYEAGTPEAQAYLDGYKEGLDECYGSGGMGMAQDIPMDISMDMPITMEDDLEEMNKTDYMKHKAKTTPGDTFQAFGQKFHDDEVLEMDTMFESWDRELTELLNEGKMKDLDIDMREMSEKEFKIKHGKSKAEMKKALSGDKKDKKTVSEGISVSVSKGQQNTPDSVTITAQDSEADALLAMIKQAGLGLFGGDDQQTSSYGAPITQPAVAAPDQGGVNDHDNMLSLMKTVSANDYEDEESSSCGSKASFVVGEEETEDQMMYNVAEEADSEEAETTADENAEAEEDKALAGADSGDEEEIDESSCSMDEDADSSYPSINGKKVDVRSIEVKGGSFNDSSDTYATYAEFIDGSPLDEYELEELSQDGDLMNQIIDQKSYSLNEWANDAGYEGSENIKDNTFEQDIEFMTRIISGGLNKEKRNQTTLPHTEVTLNHESIDDWKRLSGIK